MPGPLATDIRVDEVLTDFAMSYGQDLRKDFIADSASTVYRSPYKSDIYPVWSKADVFRSVMEEVADGDPAPEAGITVDLTNTFTCKAYKLKTLITRQQEAQSKNGLKLRKKKTRWLMQQAKLKRDSIWASEVFATGKWTRERDGVAAAPTGTEFLQFNDADSDPLGVFDTEQAYVQLQTGKLFNRAVMSLPAAQALQRHPDITDLYKHTQPGPVPMELVAKALGVDEIRVANAVENTANQGATISMARVFGKHILLVHIAEELDEQDATAITLFAWNEIDQVTADGAAIYSWWDEDREGDWLRVKQAFNVKQTAADLGCFLKDAVA